MPGGLTASWVTADEVYGQNPGFRAVCEELDLSYVLAVPVNEHVWVDTAEGPRKVRVDALGAGLPGRSFRRLSAGEGANGPRRYDWARYPIRPGEPGNWLLVRRSITDPTELAYYRCHAAPGTTLRQLVRVAGSELGGGGVLRVGER